MSFKAFDMIICRLESARGRQIAARVAAQAEVDRKPTDKQEAEKKRIQKENT